MGNRRLSDWLRDCFTRVREIRKRVFKKKGDRFIWLIIISYGLIFSVISILKYNTFHAYGYDLGIYNQAFWTTVNGCGLFHYTHDLHFNPSGCFFGTHFSPILFLLLPFYYFYQSPETLLVLQAFIVALGALPIYWLARGELEDNLWNFVFPLVYLYSPLTIGAVTFDFHVQAFVPVLLFFAFYYLKKEKWLPYAIFIILLLMTTEFASFLIVALGFYLLWTWRKDVLGFSRAYRWRRPRDEALVKVSIIALTFFAAVLGYILAIYVITSIRGAPYMLAETSPWWNIGMSPSEIIVNLLTNPVRVIELITASCNNKFEYLITLFGPLIFLSFLDPPSLIIAMPWILASFLTELTAYYIVGTQYAFFTVPGATISAVYGFKRLLASAQKGGWKNIRRNLSTLILITLLFFSLSYHVTVSPSLIEYITISNRDAQLANVLRLIPSDSSVLTQNDIFPHVSGRLHAYMNVPKDLNATFDYLIFDVTSPHFKAIRILGGDDAPLDLHKVLLGLLEKENYGILASVEGIILYKRNYMGDVIKFLPYKLECTVGNLVLASGRIVHDPTSRSGKVLMHLAEDKPAATFWYGPSAMLPPGEYLAEFRLKADSNSVGYLVTLDVVADRERILASKRLYGINFPKPGEWEYFSLYFAITKPTELELRGINVNNATTIYLDCIRVIQTSPRPKVEIVAQTYDVADLIIGAGKIENGVAVYEPSDFGYFWYGPYITLPPGAYNVTFWLMVEDLDFGHVMTMDIASNLGNILSSKELYACDFLNPKHWRAFTLTFVLDGPTSNVEFRGYNVTNATIVRLLSIDVRRIG